MTTLNDIIIQLRNNSIQHLSLDDVNISNNEEIKNFTDALSENTSLTNLYIQGKNNKLGTEGAKYLSNALTKNTTLKVLWLFNNDIGTSGAEHISQGLISNQSLEELYLYVNKIGDNGVKAISNVLNNKNCKLKKINLENNNITSEGARHIADALRTNKTLKILYIHNNNISDKGADYIAEALKDNTTLQELYLDGCRITNVGGQKIADALENNISITTFGHDNENFGLGSSVDDVNLLDRIKIYLSRNKEIINKKAEEEKERVVEEAKRQAEIKIAQKKEEERLAKLEQDLLAKLTAVQKQETDALKKKEDKVQINKEVTELQQSIKSILVQVKNHDNAIIDLSSDVTTLLCSDDLSADQFNDFQKKLNELQEIKSRLTQEVAELQGQINGTFTKVVAKHGQAITDLNSDVTNLLRSDDFNNDMFSDLTAKIQELEQKFANKGYELEKLPIIKNSNTSLDDTKEDFEVDNHAASRSRTKYEAKSPELQPPANNIHSASPLSTNFNKIAQDVATVVLDRIKIILEVSDIQGTTKQDEEFIKTLSKELRKYNKTLLESSDSNSYIKEDFETELVQKLLAKNEQHKLFTVTEVPLHISKVGKITDALSTTKSFKINHAQLIKQSFLQNLLEQVNLELKEQKIYCVTEIAYYNPVLNDTGAIMEYNAKYGPKATSELINFGYWLSCNVQNQEEISVSGQEAVIDKPLFE